MAAFLCSLERVLSQSAVEGGAMHVVGVLDGTKRGQVGVSLAAGLRPCASDRLGADVFAASMCDFLAAGLRPCASGWHRADVAAAP